MRCGRRLNPIWLALVLLCLPLSLSFSDAIVPAYPPEERTYHLTESELNELEEILRRQQQTIEMLQRSLLTSQSRIANLQDSLHRQSTTIAALERYWSEYESATRARLWRTSAISVLAGAVTGVIAASLLF